MRKFFLLFSIVFLCSPAFVFLACADAPAPASVAGKPSVPAAPAQMPDDGGLVKLDPQEMEKIFKTEEDSLRKIKIEHVHGERKQHVQSTEKTYQEAKSLYHQKRKVRAKKKFIKVEDAIADYKMTNTYLRIIDNQSIQQLKQRMRRLKEMQGAPLVINLAEEASMLDRQAAALGNDRDIVRVRRKLIRIKKVLAGLKQEKMRASQQTAEESRLDRISSEADSFDQQIFKLINAKDYQGAQKKYDEFQHAMADALVGLKQNMVRDHNQLITVRSPRNLEEKAYRLQEQAVFRQGMELYRKRQWVEAKSIFDELSYQGDERAKAYSRKLEHLIR